MQKMQGVFFKGDPMAEKPIVDVNQSILSQLENLDDEVQTSINQNEEPDDEFDKLLNSFIESEKEGEENTNLADTNTSEEKSGYNYGDDESELAQAYNNFVDAVNTIAVMREIEMPKRAFNASLLVPNYKPSIGKKIVSDTLACWDILFASYPEKLSNLSPNATDEQFLNFAEGLSDQNLQLAIISYVEILIDIENCEISYEERRLKAQRKRIERALYEEYQYRQERKKRFIEAIEKKNFPINAERLINNYFKTASKDAKGAFEVLTTNPAVYAPIENDKIKPRLFGLIKPKPKDGIRENHRIGAYLKKVKA